MKKVLVIAYSFPPVALDRSVRTLKFVKYLPSFRWQPFILTVKNPLVPSYDASLTEEIPSHVKVFRTSSIEGNCWRKRANNIPQAKKKASFCINAIKRIIERYLLLPDSRIGWIPFAIFNGLRIVKEESIDVIYASGEPFSSFISAAIIKKITRRPLVLDFRDDWVGFNTSFRQKGSWANFWEKLLEGFVLRNADAVVTVNEAIKGDIQKRHYNICKRNNKLFCINNGFDSEDFKSVKEPIDNENGRFCIVYTGSLYPRRTSEYFLSALKLILQENPELKAQIKIIFAGNICPENTSFMDQPVFKGVVENRGFLEHREALSLLKSAHLLLLIEDQLNISNRVLTGKIFEYLAAEKPVFALVNEGLLKDMVISLSAGKVAGSYNIEEIKNCLLSFIDEFRRNRRLDYQPNRELIKPFERKEQTRLLSEIMSDLRKDENF